MFPTRDMRTSSGAGAERPDLGPGGGRAGASSSHSLKASWKDEQEVFLATAPVVPADPYMAPPLQRKMIEWVTERDSTETKYNKENAGGLG